MREPSVTTITCTSSCGQFHTIDEKWPRSSREKYMPRALQKLVAELLANVANRGCVNKRCDFFDVIHENAVIESLVAVVQVLQVHILPHVVIPIITQLFHDTILLLLERLHNWRKKARKLCRSRSGTLIAIPLFQSGSCRMPTPCCLVFSGLSDVRLALSALIISSREVASDMPLMPATGTNFCTAFARFSDVAVQRTAS